MSYTEYAMRQSAALWRAIERAAGGLFEPPQEETERSSPAETEAASVQSAESAPSREAEQAAEKASVSGSGQGGRRSVSRAAAETVLSDPLFLGETAFFPAGAAGRDAAAFPSSSGSGTAALSDSIERDMRRYDGGFRRYE